MNVLIITGFLTFILLVSSVLCIQRGKYVVEDGPYGGSGGGAWTDGGGVNINGHITAIELRSGSEIDAIRAR